MNLCGRSFRLPISTGLFVTNNIRALAFTAATAGGARVIQMRPSAAF